METKGQEAKEEPEKIYIEIKSVGTAKTLFLVGFTPTGQFSGREDDTFHLVRLAFTGVKLKLYGKVI